MAKYKNVAITGRRQAGKSTLARWLLERLDRPAAGFRTLPYKKFEGGALYELVEMSTGEAAPISRLTGEGVRGIPETFEGFGVQVLARSLESSMPVVLLDEIGRFEKNSHAFLKGVFALLDSQKTVVMVLKKEDLPHIQAIRQRGDTLVLDLDLVDGVSARAVLEEWIKTP